MSIELLYALGFLLIVAAIGLVYVALRGNARFWPEDSLQWGAVGLAAVVGLFAVLMITLLAAAPDAPPAVTTLFEPANVQPEEMGRPVQDFGFRVVATDDSTRMADLRGKVVLVNIWATWCPPCRFELPELNRLQSDYRDAGLVVLNLSDESREDLLTYANELPLETVSAYVDPATVPEPLRRNFEVRPTSFVIDRQGVLRESALGMRSYDQFYEMIEPYLNAPGAEEV